MDNSPIGPQVMSDALFDQLALSPPFITADDAARYLHERITHRTVSRFGYIFQRDDGKFVSTKGIALSALSRELEWHFDGSLDTPKSLPAGYRHVGTLVASSDIHEALKQQFAAGSRKLLLPLDVEATLYACVPTFHFTISIMAASQTVPVLYYSSPHDSLVKYVRSNSAAEHAFSELLLKALHQGLAPQPDGFDSSPHWMARKMIALGELHVIVSNSMWDGSRGKVPATWVPQQKFVSETPVPLPYSWVFSAADIAAEYAHDSMVLKAKSRQTAFILKDQGREEYVVTPPVPVDVSSSLPLFSPSRVFNADQQGQLLLPPGYGVYGACHRTLPVVGLKLKQYWLYECFVEPLDLAAAIFHSRATEHPLKVVYLSTRDNAQLRYVFSRRGLERQLYGQTPEGIVTDNGISQLLKAGSLTPAAFVTRVANAGELSVRLTSPLWDVDGVIDAYWKPFRRYQAPAYSPALLSADDAARFAHEAIGELRDDVFCGAILQTPDQRFVATLPISCRLGNRFAIDAVFPTDHAGIPLIPEPYVLHGQYASCKAASLMDTAAMVAGGWTREQAYVDWQLFGDDDLFHVIDNYPLVSVAYLSCAEDALLAYEPSDSDADKALLKRIALDAAGKPLYRRAADRTVPRETVVDVATGNLRVVLGNALWGGVGTVTEAWRPGTGQQAPGVPEQVAFGAIYSTAQEAVTHAHSRVPRGYASAQTCFGFVLKHAHNSEYVVSQWVFADSQTPLFTQASLFRVNDSGAFIYPSGFTLHGLCYARLWRPEPLSSDQLWLARHFLSSQDLQSAFQAATRWRDSGSVTTLPVFISTLDNALLQFQTPISTELFHAKKQASGQFEDVHTLLASGQLTPRDFVVRVATQAWLSVLIPNECWDEPGKLGVDWVPFADFSRRAMTPAFASPFDAIRYIQARLGPPNAQTRGGLVLRRVDGLFVATEPMPVPDENFDPHWILPVDDVPVASLAPGMTTVARYRTRSPRVLPFLLADDERDIYRLMFSTEVLAKALACSHLWRQEYLLGFDGSVIGYSCDNPDNDLLAPQQKTQKALDLAQLKRELAPSAKMPHDPQSNLIEEQLRDGRVTPTAFVNRLIKTVSLSVVQGSALWGAAQKLVYGWVRPFGFISQQQSLFAVTDRTMGPAFLHIDDVARYAHQLAGARSELAFGFILKSSKNHWLATLPVNSPDTQFPLDRVFVRGQLPLGYSLQGLYLWAPDRQPAELAQRPVYRAFIAPSVLSAALNAVQQQVAAANGAYLPLYLSCADGALLRFQGTVVDEDWGDQKKREAYVKTLNSEGFNAAEYPRRVARWGSLEVLVTAQIWATPGPVTQEWRPGIASTYTPAQVERVPLGPLFSHPDDAARYLWRRYPADQGKAWLAALVRNVHGNTFLVTDPVDDSGQSVDVGLRINTSPWRRLFGQVMSRKYPGPSVKYPEGYEVMGVQQLHKTQDNLPPMTNLYEAALARNFISQREFRFFVEMFKEDNVAASRYYFTPRNGALLVYLPSYDHVEGGLLFSGWLDWQFEPPGTLPSTVITTLANAGKLYILEPDTFWQPRGHVASRLLIELRHSQRQ